MRRSGSHKKRKSKGKTRAAEEEPTVKSKKGKPTGKDGKPLTGEALKRKRHTTIWPKSLAKLRSSMRQIVEKKMLEARVVAPTPNISHKLADVHDFPAVKAFLETTRDTARQPSETTRVPSASTRATP
eukprot:jgi/Tetstr1/438402/TSEL_026968.t1